MKREVIKSDNYVVYFENDQGFTFVHCDCMKWNKTVKKQLKDDFDRLCKEHKQDVYAIHEIEDRKHKKIVKSFGFEYLKDFVGLDKKMRQIFVRRA